MALTVDELTDIRFVIGDDCNTLTDAQIQAQYDLAVTDASVTALVLPYTYVYCLRRLWGKQRQKTDVRNEFGTQETANQATQNTKALLDYWEGKAGLGGVGIVTTGVLALELDENEDDTV